MTENSMKDDYYEINFQKVSDIRREKQETLNLTSLPTIPLSTSGEGDE
jgi:hypothetical protein